MRRLQVGLVAVARGATLGCGSSGGSRDASPASAVAEPDGGSTLPPVSTPPMGSPSSGNDAAPPTPPSNDASAPSCSGKAAQPLDDTWTLPYAGATRTANVHVPASYDPTHATPVVLNFHGYSSDATQEALLSDMTAKADKEGFVVAYPQGLNDSWNAGACCGTSAMTGVDDVGFVGALVDELESRLCVDARRIFATGMSNGGFLSHRLGCEMSTRIAAIAPVAGVLGIPSCAPARPMPVMHFHGTADPLVPYDGDPALSFPSVQDTFTGWAARNACPGAPVTTFSKGDTSCSTYAGCAAGVSVTLCTVQGGGHTWPGGLPVPALGYTTDNISATDAMWTFFTHNPLP
jgi:polyhydroxybutyrate depolymerase